MDGSVGMTEIVQRWLFPFCGIGGGALGFSRAKASLDRHGITGRVEVVGGIDIDPAACRDFERIVGAPALCTDVRALTPTTLRAFAGDKAPHGVHGSHPCVGSTDLISDAKASEKHYQDLNRLLLDWTKLALETWSEEPPLFQLFENVPGITRRAREPLLETCALLEKHRYRLHAGVHNLGKLGGLAQIRDRFLLIARWEPRVQVFIYQPKEHRVRGCGEVLGPLPLPGDPRGGPMHALPDISAKNEVRLSLIRPGKDWKDIARTLDALEAWRASWGRWRAVRVEELPEDLAPDPTTDEVRWSRYRCDDWGAPASTIAGSGSNGAYGVTDERIAPEADAAWYKGKYSPMPSEEPSRTVIGGSANGASYYVDPRLSANPDRYAHKYALPELDAPARTVTGAVQVDSGLGCVVDVRLSSAPTSYANLYGLRSFASPTLTITGASRPAQGAPSVEDLRVPHGHPWTYGVLGAGDPAHTITGATGAPGCGPFSFADARIRKTPFAAGYGVLAPHRPAGTITGESFVPNGAFALVDVRLGCAPFNATYGLRGWTQPSLTVTGELQIDNGPAAVSDPRPSGLEEPPFDGAVFACADSAELVATRGAPRPRLASVALPKGKRRAAAAEKRGARPTPRVSYARAEELLAARFWVRADTRIPGNPPLRVLFAIHDWNRAPRYRIVLPSVSGYWHRALTAWECLVLQSFDAFDAEGRAWVLDGENVTAWRKAIGNAVPPLAAQAIAVQLLLTQLHAEAGLFTLSSAAVWVGARKLPEWIRGLGVAPLYVRPSTRAARLCGTFAPLDPSDPWALAVRTPTTLEVGHA